MRPLERVEGNLYVLSSKPFRARDREIAEKLFSQGWEAECNYRPHLALKLYRKAIQYDPLNARVLINIGVLQREKGLLFSAEYYFRKALEVVPHYPLAHFNLGICLGDREKIGRAKSEYLKAIALVPDYADAHFNLARLYEVECDRRKAVQHYRLHLKYAFNASPAERWFTEQKIRSLNMLELYIIPRPAA